MEVVLLCVVAALAWQQHVWHEGGRKKEVSGILIEPPEFHYKTNSRELLKRQAGRQTTWHGMA